MSKDGDKGTLGRIWGAGRDKEPKSGEKVLPMERPTDPRGQSFGHDDRSYVAFDLRDNADRLHIQRAKDPSRFPAYNYLLDISYDHFHQSAFTLIYTFMVVQVRGCNLEHVVHAINFGNCERISEFDAKRHDRPAANEALIESIEIVTADEKLMQ